MLDSLSFGFSKTKEKTEKEGTENVKQDSRTLPIVPDDWMRMYGQLADLIGFGQSFRGGTVDDGGRRALAEGLDHLLEVLAEPRAEGALVADRDDLIGPVHRCRRHKGVAEAE